MDTEEKQLIIEHFVHAYNSFDINTMVSLLHPDIEFRYIADGELLAIARGIDEFRALARESKSLYSSRKQTVMEYHEKQDQVMVEIAYTGILAVDLPDGAKAGDVVNLKGLSEFIFQDGKVYRLTDFS